MEKDSRRRGENERRNTNIERIYRILSELRPEFNYRESKNFIDDGMLDSFDIVSLVTELEECFGIRIDGLDIVPENFASVEAIAGLIRKSGGAV